MHKVWKMCPRYEKCAQGIQLPHTGMKCLFKVWNTCFLEKQCFFIPLWVCFIPFWVWKYRLFFPDDRFRYIIKLHGKHGVGLSESRREESEPFPPFFPFTVIRAVFELWDIQTLVRILRGFGQRHCVPASLCAACKRLVTAHNTIRQSSVFPCRLHFPPSRETRSTLEQCNSRLRATETKNSQALHTGHTEKLHAGDRRKEARHARGRRTCLFPTQCIARYTEG